MKRGKLLAMVPAASAWLALRSKGAPLPEGPTTSAGFAISVQCWSFKEFTLFEAIELAAAAGAGAVELYPGQKIGGPLGGAKLDPARADEQVAAILDHCGRHRIAPVNFGVTEVPKDEARARVVFEFARRLGMYGITTESLGSLDTLERLAAEFDLRVCFHNHPKPTRLWRPEVVARALEGRDERLGHCADLGHWASSGLDPLEVVRAIAPRVRSLHMKDRAEIGTWTHDRPFGTGIIDLAAILDELRRHGFAGNVSIEYEHNWKTSLPEIAQCVGYLRGYSRMRA